LIEYSDGFESPIPSHEVHQSCPDSGFMAICLYLSIFSLLIASCQGRKAIFPVGVLGRLSTNTMWVLGKNGTRIMFKWADKLTKRLTFLWIIYIRTVLNVRCKTNLLIAMEQGDDRSYNGIQQL
jgi:hypothetical protein